jgi:hypothetical protein
MFDAWQTEARKPGATLDLPRAEILDELRRDNVTAQDVRHVTRGAMRDDWGRDKVLQFRVIFGKRDQFERFLELGRPDVAPPKPLARGQRPPQPDSGWRPSPEMYLTAEDLTA